MRRRARFSIRFKGISSRRPSVRVRGVVYSTRRRRRRVARALKVKRELDLDFGFYIAVVSNGTFQSERLPIERREGRFRSYARLDARQPRNGLAVVVRVAHAKRKRKPRAGRRRLTRV